MNVTFDVMTRRGRARVREVFTGCRAGSLSANETERAWSQYPALPGSHREAER